MYERKQRLVMQIAQAYESKCRKALDAVIAYGIGDDFSVLTWDDMHGDIGFDSPEKAEAYDRWLNNPLRNPFHSALLVRAAFDYGEQAGKYETLADSPQLESIPEEGLIDVYKKLPPSFADKILHPPTV